MNYNVKYTDLFLREAKKLSKRYRSFKDDLKFFVQSLCENPFQGDTLAPGIRKIRMAITSKGKGKSGGARVITYNVLTSEQDGQIYLMLIYDKKDTPNIKIDVMKCIIKDLEIEGDTF
ncbi:MAG: addiction module toxin RelE [Muribaculaceae bacterium]|nr:addiction module toxin RelE [Muribaculaceae bacterium]